MQHEVQVDFQSFILRVDQVKFNDATLYLICTFCPPPTMMEWKNIYARGYRATNQASDLVEDLMGDYQQCLPVVSHVVQGRPCDSRYWDQELIWDAIYARVQCF